MPMLYYLGVPLYSVQHTPNPWIKGSADTVLPALSEKLNN